MNRNLLLLLIAVLVIGGVGVVGFNSFRSQPVTPAAVSPTPLIETILSDKGSADLEEQNDSNESGKATLIENNGQTTVTLDMAGEPEGASQPAHIHDGACPNPGAIKYSLNPVVNNKSETVINVTIDQLKGMRPLAINVHKSPSEIQVYVACGRVDL
jgi:Cu/Zn superoxide dismutase